MRAGIDATTLALQASGAFDAHWQVLVANGSGTLIDVSNRLGGISGSLPSPDAPIGTLRAEFLRDLNDDPATSLAPLIASDLNVLNDGTTFSALLQVGRVVVAKVALTARGGVRPSTFYEVFRGRIRSVSWGGWYGGASIDCNDQAGALQRTKSEREYTYAAGTAIETAAQSVVTNNGFSTTTLSVPAATGAVLPNKYEPGLQKSTWEQVQALAQSVGFVCWHRYDATSTAKLTLFEPNRNKLTSDFTFNHIYEVNRLEVDEEEIGNVLYDQYTDADGARQLAGPVEDAASIAKYGGIRRSFWISEEEGSPVTDNATATGLLTKILPDLADPDAIAEYKVPLFLFGEVSVDRYTFPADDRHYDSDQTLAPFAISFSHQQGQLPYSTIAVRGKPSGGSGAWKARRAAPGTVRDDPAVFLVNDFRIISEDATTVTLGWTPGAKITESWSATATVDAPYSTDQWGAVKAAVAPLAAGTTTLTVTKPAEGKVTLVQVEGRWDDATTGELRVGQVWRAILQGSNAPLAFTPAFSQSGGSETLTLTITDPRGVAGTPLLSLDGAAGASMTAGSPGVWTSTYTLDPKHNRVIRVTVPRTDGGESIVLGPWTADVDTQAEVVSVSVSYNGAGVATVQAQFDTDTAVGAGNAEFSQSLTVWTPATVDSNLRASFTVAQENDQALTVYVRGKHADGTPGLEVPVGIDRFVPRLSAAPSFSQSGSDETLTLTLSDPSGVAGPPTVSLDGAAEVSMTDGGGGVWSTTYTLDAKHNRTIRATVPRTDGEPSLVLGPWTSDIDATADVVDSSVAYDGAGTATVSATFDTDTTAGVGQAEYSDDDGGNWTAFDVDANRRGSFSYTQSTSATTTLLVRGKAGSAAGTPVQVVVSKYVPLSTYPGRILTIDVSNMAVGSCPTTTMQNRVDVVFRDAPAGSTWDLARLENGESVALVADHIAVTTGSHTDSVTGPSAEKYELPSVGGTPVQVSYRVLLYPATRTSTPGDVKESAALTQNRTVCS